MLLHLVLMFFQSVWNIQESDNESLTLSSIRLSKQAEKTDAVIRKADTFQIINIPRLENKTK